MVKDARCQMWGAKGVGQVQEWQNVIAARLRHSHRSGISLKVRPMRGRSRISPPFKSIVRGFWHKANHIDQIHCVCSNQHRVHTTLRFSLAWYGPWYGGGYSRFLFAPIPPPPSSPPLLTGHSTHPTQQTSIWPPIYRNMNGILCTVQPSIARMVT